MAIAWSRYVLLLIIALIIGGGTAWFFRSFDRVEEEVRSSMSAAARANPWLALEQFLSGAGAEIKQADWEELWQQTWPADVTIISNRMDRVLDPERLATLRDWLNRGGELIVPLNSPFLSDDEFIALSGIFAELGISQSYELLFNDEPSPQQFEFEGTEETISVNFDSAYSLYLDGRYEPVGSLGEEGAFHLLQFEMGLGRITVLSDGEFLYNGAIGEYDHAWFIYAMSGVSDGRSVWLLHGFGEASLLAWLWNKAWMIILVLMALLVLWLWQRNLVLGPILTPPTRLRRHLGEHLHASAEFLWRHQQSQQLFKATCDTVLRRWQKQHPWLQTKTPHKQWLWIASHAGMEQADGDWLAQQTSRVQAVRKSQEADRLMMKDHDCLRLSQYLQHLLWCVEQKPVIPTGKH